eukprot:COSAG01_NODE_801_length_13466_cov_585.329693_7_plen_144_part_00
MLKARSRPGRRTRAGRGTWRCSRCAASHPPAFKQPQQLPNRLVPLGTGAVPGNTASPQCQLADGLLEPTANGGCLIHRTNLVISTDDAMAGNVREYQSTRDHQRSNVQSTSPTWGRVAVYPSSSSNLRAVLLTACGWLSGSRV